MGFGENPGFNPAVIQRMISLPQVLHTAYNLHWPSIVGAVNT